MNCFNNNRPNLSSSERIQNKKAKTLFKSNVISFQTASSKGYSGDVGFNNNGTLRNTDNYEMLLNVNRGSALCADGAYRNCSVDLSSPSAVVQKGLNACKGEGKVKLTLSQDDVYSCFDGSSNNPVQNGNANSGFASMYSYNLDSASNDREDNYLLSDFESALKQNDLSNSLLVLDPSNTLFGANDCSIDTENSKNGSGRYLNYASMSEPTNGTLRSGNNTKQNYLISYDPKNCVNFNVDGKIYNN